MISKIIIVCVVLLLVCLNITLTEISDMLLKIMKCYEIDKRYNSLFVKEQSDILLRDKDE